MKLESAFIFFQAWRYDAMRWLCGRKSWLSDLLHISMRNRRNSGRNSFNTVVGRGSRSHDFDVHHRSRAISTLMFITSSVITNVSVPKFSIVGGTDDWTGHPAVDLRTASIYSLKKSSRSCAVALSFDLVFLALSDPRLVMIEHHSFCG